MVGWGTQLHVLLETAELAQQQLNASCEVIDLQSIMPWDVETVANVSIQYLYLISILDWDSIKS